MLRVRKKSTAFFAALMTVILCFFCFTACDSGGHDQTEQPPVISYSFGSVDVNMPSVICAGDTARISATAYARSSDGKNVSSDKGFEYESGAPSVATVSADGKITGLASGTAQITVRHGEYKAEKTVSLRVAETTVPDLASGSGINVIGRVVENANGLLLRNPASGFETAFMGSELKAAVNGSGVRNVLYVAVDGEPVRVTVPESADDCVITLATGLSSGELHTVAVYKTTGEDSSVLVKSISTENGAFYDPPARAAVKISVYGDGTVAGKDITEVGDATQGYAFAAAQTIGAEADILAGDDVSVVLGAVKLKDVWNKYGITNGAVYSPERPSDIIVIDAGANDASAIKAGVGTARDFTDGYKALLAAMRAANADAHIVCCYGATPLSNATADAVRRTVKELNNEGDGKVYAVKLERVEEKISAQGKYPDAACHAANARILSEVFDELVGAYGKPKDDYDTQKEDIHVILLGGQSNMEGNSWHKFLKEDTNAFKDEYAEYEAGFDGIKMSFVNHLKKRDNAPDFQSVRLGFGGSVSNPADTFGPDIGMAKALHDGGYDNKVAFIKFAQGGTTFYPRNNNETWSAPTGKLYNGFVRYVKTCLRELSKTYNVTIDAMCWMQGESDADNQSAVDNYDARLSNFIQSVRNALSMYNSDFTFYDAQIVWPPDWAGDRPLQINAKKRSLVDTVPRFSIIDNVAMGLTTDTEPYGNPDKAHYDSESEIRLGKAFAESYMKDHPLL